MAAYDCIRVLMFSKGDWRESQYSQKAWAAGDNIVLFKGRNRKNDLRPLELLPQLMDLLQIEYGIFL